MSKKVYKKELKNIHSITQSGEFLSLIGAAKGSKIDVKKHLKGLSKRVMITTSGIPGNSYNIEIKINPILKVRNRKVESTDEVIENWNNPNTLEYSFTLEGRRTWRSEEVFGEIPIHSFELIDDGNLSDGVDLIFVPMNLNQ